MLQGLYYQTKPLLPWRLRLALRRLRARYRRATFADVWPIDPAAAVPPKDWKGWPNNKRFAVVLTHDVEGRIGLERCQRLLDLEKSLGFRSSFNLVPEGEYPVAPSLREALTRANFEVGVHDLHHDGKLYRSRAQFDRDVCRINHYLEQWQAAGFRSAFMLHKLDWLHALNILYDASTFDTDPFEPQPDGMHTIFPFWVPGPNGAGFVELPYTLVQDITLFLILQEDGPGIWRRKLDWIAEHGGMALLDTHPDYMAFDGKRANTRTYPVQYYQDILEYITTRYQGQFWQPLPREVAAYIAQQNGRRSALDPAIPASEPSAATA